MQGLDHELAKSFGHDSTDGVLVSGILTGTPAAEAGLKVGDIIVTLDGKSTQTPTQLMRIIANSEPNTPITLGFIRSGKSMTTDCDTRRTTKFLQQHIHTRTRFAEHRRITRARNSSARHGICDCPRRNGQGCLCLLNDRRWISGNCRVGSRRCHP